MNRQPEIYVDQLRECVPTHSWPYQFSCHLFVSIDTPLEALHEFAESLGLRREWFQFSNGKLPHYDLTKSKRVLAVRSGAIEADREFVVGCIRQFREAHQQAELAPGTAICELEEI